MEKNQNEMLNMGPTAPCNNPFSKFERFLGLGWRKKKEIVFNHLKNDQIKNVVGRFWDGRGEQRETFQTLSEYNKKRTENMSIATYEISKSNYLKIFGELLAEYREIENKEEITLHPPIRYEDGYVYFYKFDRESLSINRTKRKVIGRLDRVLFFKDFDYIKSFRGEELFKDIKELDIDPNLAHIIYEICGSCSSDNSQITKLIKRYKDVKIDELNEQKLKTRWDRSSRNTHTFYRSESGDTIRVHAFRCAIDDFAVEVSINGEPL